MILAADFGGTTIKLGIVREKQIAARSRLDACADRPMTERLEAVASEWERLLKEDGYTPADCAGVALALPFLADPKRPRVLGEFGKFPGATAIDFAEWSEARLGLPMALENDLRVALLGEWSAGAARGMNDAVMFALGTGIGCAAMSGGRLLARRQQPSGDAFRPWHDRHRKTRRPLREYRMRGGSRLDGHLVRSRAGACGLCRQRIIARGEN